LSSTSIQQRRTAFSLGIISEFIIAPLIFSNFANNGDFKNRHDVRIWNRFGRSGGLAGAGSGFHAVNMQQATLRHREAGE
jgi:hypothetical protein